MIPNEVRAKVLECEQKARATRDAGVICMYTELANQWRELADQIDADANAIPIANAPQHAGR